MKKSHQRSTHRGASAPYAGVNAAVTAISAGGFDFSTPLAAGATLTINVTRTVQAAKAGIGFGNALAIAISWSVHKSILWAIVQGIFGWFYVIYFALTRNR